MAKKSKPRVFTLGRKAYGRLFRLVRWMEATPDEIDIGGAAQDRIHQLMQEPLSRQLEAEEGVTVELSGAALVAVVEDWEGNETRVPIREWGVGMTTTRKPQRGPKK